MLTDAQIDHFRTFGFLVLPGYLDERETTAPHRRPAASPRLPLQVVEGA
jgi:hypothetical protein